MQIPSHDDIILWKFHLRFNINTPKHTYIPTIATTIKLLHFIQSRKAEYEYAGHEWRLEFKRRRKRNTLQTNTKKTRKKKKRKKHQTNSTWITFVAKLWSFSKYLRQLFSFFSFSSNGKERKRNGNQEKRQANQTEMSVNYWKNVFLSPLCDRSYKTGIYFTSAWIDFAFTGANIRVKNHEVCERVRERVTLDEKYQF